MKKTKIVATISDKRCEVEFLEKLYCAGMNVVRLNTAHQDMEQALKVVENVRKVSDNIAILIDTKGPEVRTMLMDEPMHVDRGETVYLTGDPELKMDGKLIHVSYPYFAEDIKVGDKVLVDDGDVELIVVEKKDHYLKMMVTNEAVIKNRKSINVPGASLKLKSLSDKDRAFIDFAIDNNLDFIAHSFVRNKEDVMAIQAILDARGSKIKVIAKIENQEGVDNFDEILAAADGVMVARGDLGVEIPAARVPILQKQMIRKGLQQGKPVITATQMLDSMMRNPRPTRAEVSDVANAVYDGTGSVMLSGETAGGKYPVEALTAMVGIVTETESAIDYWKQFQKQRVLPASNINDAITHTCCLTAKDLDAKAILTATSSGRSARMICRFRPACPIAALTMHEKVRRQLNISWGVTPYLTGEVNSTDRIFSLSAEVALKERLVENGDTVVITAGVPLGKSGSTNLIKAQVIDEEAM